MLFSSLLNMITPSVGQRVGVRWVGGSVCKWYVVGWSVVGGSVVGGFNKTRLWHSYTMLNPSFLQLNLLIFKVNIFNIFTFKNV